MWGNVMMKKNLATPASISGEGKVTRTIAHGSGAISDISTTDNVSWQVTYDQDWLTGTGEEIIAAGTDPYLTGTAVDGLRRKLSGTIVVGNHEITEFSFLSLQFNDGQISGVAFLSDRFDVPFTEGGNPPDIDQLRIMTSGAHYGSENYDPVFSVPLDPVEWTMDSQIEGEEYLVFGYLNISQPITLAGQGDVTHAYEHGGGGTAGFTVGDNVSWQVVYNKYWLTGIGVEIIAMGTDPYLLGKEVDGLRRKLSCEIIVGTEEISNFCFFSLRFEDGILTGIAFLSDFFDVSVTQGGNPLFDDEYRILTAGAQYDGDDDAYNPVFQSTLDPVGWKMDSKAEGGEYLVRGVLTY